MKSKLLNLFFVVVMVFFVGNISAQELEKTSSISISGDLVSTFVWRGAIASPTLNFQPALSFSKNNFEFGLWGSADNLGKFKEIDVFVTYSIKGLSVTFTDYFWNQKVRYFNYDNKSTGHNFELGISYENENFPLRFYAGTMIYGEDKKYLYDLSETDLSKSNFSTYLELSYSLKMVENDFNLFVAATPFSGMYGKGFSMVYAGITASKKIKISEKFALPLSVTFAANPQSEDFFIVLAITLE